LAQSVKSIHVVFLLEVSAGEKAVGGLEWENEREKGVVRDLELSYGESLLCDALSLSLKLVVLVQIVGSLLGSLELVVCTWVLGVNEEAEGDVRIGFLVVDVELLYFVLHVLAFRVQVHHLLACSLALPLHGVLVRDLQSELRVVHVRPDQLLNLFVRRPRLWRLHSLLVS